MSEKAKILLEAAQHIHTIRSHEPDRGKAQGLQIAIKELKRLASVARDEHKLLVAKRKQEARDYNAKCKAFLGQ